MGFVDGKKARRRKTNKKVEKKIFSRFVQEKVSIIGYFVHRTQIRHIPKNVHTLRAGCVCVSE